MTTTQTFLAVFFHNMIAITVIVVAPNAQAALDVVAEYGLTWLADGEDALCLGHEVDYSRLTRALEDESWGVALQNQENDWCVYEQV